MTTPNAIERLRDNLDLLCRDSLEAPIGRLLERPQTDDIAVRFVQAWEDAAAVDALYQAASALDDAIAGITEDGHSLVPFEDVCALAAAVRRVDGGRLRAALAGPDTPADSHYRERPIEEDFYLDPRGEWVYRWSDERRVLKPADSQEDKT